MRAAGPVDGVLQDARHAAVVFRRNEQHRVDRGDRVLKRSACRRVIVIEIAVVQRKISNGNLLERKVVGRQPDQRLGQRPVDRVNRQTTDEVSDLVFTHAKLHLLSVVVSAKSSGMPAEPPLTLLFTVPVMVVSMNRAAPRPFGMTLSFAT